MAMEKQLKYMTAEEFANAIGCWGTDGPVDYMWMEIRAEILSRLAPLDCCISELLCTDGVKIRCEMRPDHKYDHYGHDSSGVKVQWTQWPPRAAIAPGNDTKCGAPLGSSGHIAVFCDNGKGHDNDVHESGNKTRTGVMARYFAGAMHEGLHSQSENSVAVGGTMPAASAHTPAHQWIIDTDRFRPFDLNAAYYVSGSHLVIMLNSYTKELRGKLEAAESYLAEARTAHHELYLQWQRFKKQEPGLFLGESGHEVEDIIQELYERALTSHPPQPQAQKLNCQFECTEFQYDQRCTIHRPPDTVGHSSTFEFSEKPTEPSARCTKIYEHVPADAFTVECSNCKGHTAIGTAPIHCPACGVKFDKWQEDMRPLPAAAEKRETPGWVQCADSLPAFGTLVHLLVRDAVQKMPAFLEPDETASHGKVWAWLDGADSMPFELAAAWCAVPSAPESKPAEKRETPEWISETGWLIENGEAEPSYLMFENGVPAWTKNSLKAIRLARREDAEMLAEECEDAWRICQHEWSGRIPPAPESKEPK